MNSPTPHTELLRALDPARETLDLTPAERSHRDALLASLVETASSIPTADRPRWARHPRRTIFTAVSAAAALALVTAIAITALPGATNPPAASFVLPAHGSLASWTSSPQRTDANPADVQACTSALGSDSSPGHPATALTSEKRGDFTSLFIEQGASDGYCALSGGTVENSVNFAGLKAHPLTDPNSASISVTQGAEWMYVVSGRAGANVTSLTVTNPDTGAAVTAALAKGVWSAWWPVGEGSRAWGPTAGGYADGISISYTLIDGTTHVSTNASDTGSDDSASNLTDNPPALGALPGWAAGAAALTPTSADVNTCAASAAGWPTGSASVVLAETRGGFESLLLDKDGDRAYCVLTAGAVTWSRELGTMPTIDPPTGSSPAPDAPTAALVMDESVDGVVPGTRISTALGTADPGVTAVTLHLAAGHDVQATVANGSWMAWWPEDETAALNGAVVDGTTITAKPAPAPTSTPAPTDAPIPAGPPTLSFTTADGVEHTPVN